jgi:hypothetical protein
MPTKKSRAGKINKIIAFLSEKTRVIVFYTP